MTTQERNDAEANYFALHLLMPRFLLERQVRGRAFTDTLPEEIARTFNVSVVWATVRLQEFFGKGL